MVKQFSSPRRFAFFQVVSASGEVPFQGGPPPREIPSDALGAAQSVWVGDFTSLRIPGRYRVGTDDGMSSYPFDVGPGVFDATIRAVQRAFDYQRAFSRRLRAGARQLHHALGRNYQQIVYVSGLPGVTRGRTHAFHHWFATLNAAPYLFPRLWLEAQLRHRSRPTSVCHTADTSTPLEGRYTANDSWSTNELDVDGQGATLYNLYLGRWWAARAPPTRAVLRSVPNSPSKAAK
jgi:hypothetical protein